MERIESYEALVQQMKDLRKAGLKSSNLYMLPDALKQKVDSGSMYVIRNKDCILILDDNGSFYRTYYILNENNTIWQDVDLPKDAVIEFPYNQAINSKQQFQINCIQAMGFMLERESAEMMLPADKAVVTEMEKSFDVGIAVPEENERILEMINNSFNPLFAFIPTSNELLNNIICGKVLVIRKRGEIVAALNSDQERNNAIIRHIVVESSFRGQGAGDALIHALFQKYKSSVEYFRHWVDINNKIAVSLYEKYGYTYSIKRANEYVRRKTK